MSNRLPKAVLVPTFQPSRAAALAGRLGGTTGRHHSQVGTAVASGDPVPIDVVTDPDCYPEPPWPMAA
jgi:hypothetical protein